jgi:membrane protease YdiL (CAAX protease family)
MLNSSDKGAQDSIFTHVLTPGFLLAFFLFAYNNVVNFIPATLHGYLDVWMNLVVLGLVWLWSRRYLNLTTRDIGWTKQNLGKGVLYGFGVSAVIVLPFVILLCLLPALGFEVKTPRLEAVAQDIFWWRIFVRIPIGTAFFEEMLFRGIFYGYLMKKMSQKKTILITSLFFAFWHIIPAYEVVSQHLQATSIGMFVVLWLVLMFGSFVGGLLFAWIRYRTKNIAGCIIAHALINVLSLVSASIVW